MMKLTLCVPLIWMLLSSAGALECVQDSHGSDPQPCNSTDVQCLTIAVQRFNRMGDNTTSRTCAPSSLCSEDTKLLSLSFNDVKIAASLQCCSTDGCNNKDIPFPQEQKPNGLQCVTCYPLVVPCNQTLDCVGIEDRCLTVNMTEGAETHLVHGCASASLCEGDTELKFRALTYQSIYDHRLQFSAPKCCGTSLCNSDPN
ncbi:phospholipase A2 inhibitor gamma subunit B-like [Halichoeres trimaculatus]|uniref:phospholipase A2 inhibitor gamma subunit B-like n=1 Tax=Halichoeres trimaculatus TaxID=147232 RepID=UPI003D9DB99D